jgi:hypothetical protein
MERLKVVIALLLCAGMASAATFNATSSGGEWDSDGVTTWYEAGYPTAADTVYMVYNANPVTVSAGQTEAAGYAYVSLYDALGAGDLSVDGQLDISGGIFIGNWYTPSTPNDDFVLNIGDAGVVNIGGYGLYSTGLGQNNTQVFNVNGGLLNIDASLTLAGTQAAMTVSGDGVLDIAGGLASGGLTIDIVGNDAMAIIQTALYDSLLGGGGMMANGAVGDAGDFLVTDLGGDMSQVQLIPEPATMVLLGLGALVLRRKK